MIQRALGEDGVRRVALASMSDIRRYAALYKYGGIWFDTDTIFLSDVRPLMGVDFVSLTQGEFFNNAVVGTSAVHSEFMKRTLWSCAELFRQDPNNKNYFRSGPSLFGEMRNDMSEPMPFSALPGCLVDTSWVGGFPGGLGWDEMFNRNATDDNLEFLSNNETGAFSFHWHGRWKNDIERGSSASIAHANFVQKLHLDPTEFGAADEIDLTAWKDSLTDESEIDEAEKSCEPIQISAECTTEATNFGSLPSPNNAGK